QILLRFRRHRRQMMDAAKFQGHFLSPCTAPHAPAFEQECRSRVRRFLAGQSQQTDAVFRTIHYPACCPPTLLGIAELFSVRKSRLPGAAALDRSGQSTLVRPTSAPGPTAPWGGVAQLVRAAES